MSKTGIKNHASGHVFVEKVSSGVTVETGNTVCVFVILYQHNGKVIEENYAPVIILIINPFVIVQLYNCKVLNNWSSSSVATIGLNSSKHLAYHCGI